MNKWIFLIIMYSSVCFGQNPPFSEIYRRPSLSPYLRLNQDLDLNYHQEIRPFLEKQKLIETRNTIKPFEKIQYYPSNTIRPTGHPTYFMYIPYYNFK